MDRSIVRSTAYRIDLSLRVDISFLSSRIVSSFKAQHISRFSFGVILSTLVDISNGHRYPSL